MRNKPLPGFYNKPKQQYKHKEGESYKGPLQPELTKRWDTFVRENLGAHGINDRGNTSWPPNYEKIRQTTFNESWRRKTHNEGVALNKLKKETEAFGWHVRRQAEKNKNKQ